MPSLKIRRMKGRQNTSRSPPVLLPPGRVHRFGVKVLTKKEYLALASEPGKHPYFLPIVVLSGEDIDAIAKDPRVSDIRTVGEGRLIPTLRNGRQGYLYPMCRSDSRVKSGEYSTLFALEQARKAWYTRQTRDSGTSNNRRKKLVLNKRRDD